MRARKSRKVKGAPKRLAVRLSTAPLHENSARKKRQKPSAAMHSVASTASAGGRDVVPEPEPPVPTVKGMPLTVVAHELFCGSAGVAAEWASRGADALGFDCVRNECRPKGPIVTMDLTQKHGQTLVMESVTSGRVHVNIMAPPCGTASRARERPIKNGPKPLRSEAQPMGLPGFTGEDLDRVQAANALYALVARVASACNEAGVLWVVENPARSIFWWIPEIVALLELHGVHDVYYDTCMFGGQRLKHQRLRGNFPELAAMGEMCDKAHVHLPYSRSQSGFDTALEAEYPRFFCVKLVDCCVAALQRKGLRLPDPKFVSNRYVDVREQGLRKIAAWKQPRGCRSPQLLPEFKEVISLPKDVLG